MTNISCSYFSHWPYDEALAWMDRAYLAVYSRPDDVMIGCGSHKETVITLGRKTNQHVITPSSSVLVRKLERGGGATAHEPGQLVLYPILHLDRQRISVVNLVSLLEEAMLNFLLEIGIHGDRCPLGPGVYVKGEKLGFIGLRIKNHIAHHGLALNLFNSAEIFSTFYPCGHKSLKVTSACFHSDLIHPLSFYMERLTHHVVQGLKQHDVLSL